MLVIKNGRVMDPKTGLDQVCDLLVDQGKIVEMGPSLSHEGAQVIDASGKVVAPGLVDIHVHFREPGQTQGRHPYRSSGSSSRWFYDSRHDG